jgi:hypothetical protein
MFCSDYPRGVVNCLWLWWFPALEALPVALALPVPFLLACPCRPVALLCLPPRPLPRRLPTALAAIALARLPRMKALLASLQQIPPHPRPAGQSLPPATLLIFGMACSTLGRPMGGEDSRGEGRRLCLGEYLRGSTTGLQAVWVILGKHRWYAESRNMRSPAGWDSAPADRLSALVKEPGDRRSA